MNTSVRASQFIIAGGVIVAGLIYFREILTPFALAIFVWLIIKGAGRIVHERAPFVPQWLATGIALIGAALFLIVTGVVIADNAADFAGKREVYVDKIDRGLAAMSVWLFPNDDALTTSMLLERINVQRFLQELAGSAQDVVGNFVFVAIYVAFLFSAEARFSGKLDRIFVGRDARGQATKVLGAIKQSMERYLFVQTQLSVVTTALTFVTLWALGVENAIFWSFLIFILNYIPTIGSIIAAVLPTLFAMVQFDEWWRVAAVAVGVGFWQFAIGNFLQPRMMGASLNLSTIVVLLALALWGSIWGLTGAFLSTPLTVMLMIVFTQFPSTHWVAVLLSENGRPEEGMESPAPMPASELAADIHETRADD